MSVAKNPPFNILNPPLNYPSGFTPHFNEKTVNHNSMNLDTIGWMDWLLATEQDLAQIQATPIDPRQLIIGAFEYYLYHIIRQAKQLIADDYAAGANKSPVLLQNRQSDDSVEAVMPNPNVSASSINFSESVSVVPVAVIGHSNAAVLPTNGEQVPYGPDLHELTPDPRKAHQQPPVVNEATEEEGQNIEVDGDETEDEDEDEVEEDEEEFEPQPQPSASVSEVSLATELARQQKGAGLMSIEIIESEQTKIENQFPDGPSLHFEPLFFETVRKEQIYLNYSEEELVQTKTLLARALQDLSTYPLSQIIELAVQCGVSAALVRSSLSQLAQKGAHSNLDIEFMELLASNEPLRKKWNKYIRCLKALNLRDFLLTFFGQNTQITTLRLYARFSANSEDITLAEIQQWQKWQQEEP